ncbi:MAG: hypothetical protein WBB73_02635 [Candidatus Aminicenantaceae bacterium]
MKESENDPKLRLSILLWLMAVHSFLVGTGLIIQVPKMMELLGFRPVHEHFFPAQGGIFHIVMAFGYALAASDSVRYRCLILFSIFVKAVATLFLLSYFVFIDGILMILISGIGDGVFCVILYLSYISYDKHLKKKSV